MGVLAVNNESAEQIPDVTQRVVQKLGHFDVDARHDEHLLQGLGIRRVLRALCRLEQCLVR